MEILETLKNFMMILVAFFSPGGESPAEQIAPHVEPVTHQQEFLSQGLKTNTDKRSIELDQVLNGGPGKDGIPAINNPLFVPLQEALAIEDPTTEGLVVSINGESKFYPYTILVWHEIVNDTVGGTDVSVTFCPLCGSGIVFDRLKNNTLVTFGVSGLLWESNLLMYDNINESLWSQAKGEAVIGEDLGHKLTIIDSDLISLEVFAEQYPEGVVLSRKTGHTRAYGFYPYGDYEQNDDYIFPVSNTDARFDGKELMYVVPLGTGSAAFPRSALIAAGGATLTTDEGVLTAQVLEGSITVTDSAGKTLPGYHEMWFSWATHNAEGGFVWEQ